MDTDGNRIRRWVSHGRAADADRRRRADIPWTDLAYSLSPTAARSTTPIAGPTDDEHPIGVRSSRSSAACTRSGTATGYYAPPGVDPAADLTT